ncbi:hypothetical protein ACMA5I_05845 [Paracoccaceae bacterium GXU_MW_L88]
MPILITIIASFAWVAGVTAGLVFGFWVGVYTTLAFYLIGLICTVTLILAAAFGPAPTPESSA